MPVVCIITFSIVTEVAVKMKRLSKYTGQEQTEIKAAVLLLRFRCTDPTPSSHKYVGYSAISKALNISYNTVQHICRLTLTPSKQIRPERAVSKLGQEHVDFLTNPQTLERWAGETLKRRTILFHRQFPDKRIAVTSLRRLYLRHNIKRKKVRQEKHMPVHILQSY
jgi:hypothetical protein